MTERFLSLPPQEHTVVAEGIHHDFGSDELPMPVLFEVSFQLEPGEIVIMTGPSGSGKTTLLTLIGALRSVQSGSLSVLGRQLRGLDEQGRVEIRRRLGFIFQAHNLFESLTALQNVSLALELHGESRHEIDRRAKAMLGAVGLGDRMGHKPEALSGGQRQRVAVARALAHRPGLILADEPTAALDAQTGRQVIDLLQELAHEQNTSTLLVTHDNRILDVADRIVNMVDGRIVSDIRVGESLEICEFLAKVPAFASHSPGGLTEIAEHMRRRTFRPDEVIFREGEAGHGFFIIRSGTVRILDDPEGHELAILEPGQFFGEVALMTGQPRNATAISVDETELLFLAKEEFQQALNREKSFRDQLLQVFSVRHS